MAFRGSDIYVLYTASVLTGSGELLLGESFFVLPGRLIATHSSGRRAAQSASWKVWLIIRNSRVSACTIISVETDYPHIYTISEVASHGSLDGGDYTFALQQGRQIYRELQLLEDVFQRYLHIRDDRGPTLFELQHYTHVARKGR